MQTYTSTNMNDTTTGMTLRSGNTYYKSSSDYGTHNYVLDGEDFVPLSSLSEFSWTWAKKVHETLSKTDNWTPETSYEFLVYLEATASSWCQTAWASERSDTIEFSENLMSLVRDLAHDAASVKHYPNTRSKKHTFGNDMGWCNGIIRLAKEIEMEWNVASHMNQYDSEVQEGEHTMSVDSDWEEPVLESNEEDDQPVVHQLSFDGDIDYRGQGGYGHV